MAAPAAWMKKVVSEVPELNAIPLFGNAPPFDWKRLSSQLTAQFGASHFSVRARSQSWREGDEIREGLGKQLLTYPIVVTPLGTVFWMMSQEDMTKLTGHLLTPQGTSHPFTSEILQEGFYRYLLLEALDTAQGMQTLQNLTLHLSEEERALEGKVFCVDVEIALGTRSCWGRLAIPIHFRTAWIHHFEQAPSEYMTTELSQRLELSLGVKVGSLLLHQSDLKSVQVGDFLALDRGSYDPRNQTGAAYLCLGSTPLFNIKIHHNKISLVDYAFYYEDTMQHKTGEPPERPPLPPAVEGEVVAIKELPIFINVEIARLKMTLDKLMHIQPGNTLELPIHPEQSVSLLVNGQKVGRAELVHLGETLGLRILEIG